MNNLRRDFLRQAGLVSGGFLIASPMKAMNALTTKSAALNQILNEVTIMHTNDLHNCISPQQVGKWNGLGGLKKICECIRETHTPQVLVDAGDFLDVRAGYAQNCQMIEQMNRTGYHAATIGNREMEKGQEYLSALVSMMKFPLVNCNYSFEHPQLKGQIKEYVVIKSGKYKIGITGVGIDPASYTDGIGWHHPYEKANAVADYLKKHNLCDLVLCLSHLGYEQLNGAPCNIEFAKASENIDVIISGHGNTIKPGLMVLKNRKQQEVLVSHAGPSGVLIKQISIGFNKMNGMNNISCKNFIPGSKSELSPYHQLQEIISG
jgi:5'-nucleotidase